MKHLEENLKENHHLWTRDIPPEDNGSFKILNNAVCNHFSSSIVTFLECKVTYKIMFLCKLCKKKLAAKIYDLVTKFVQLSPAGSQTKKLISNPLYGKPCKIHWNTQNILTLPCAVNHSISYSNIYLYRNQQKMEGTCTVVVCDCLK